MNELSKILGSVERLRLLRFLLRDIKKQYTLSDIEEKTKIKLDILKKELVILLSINLIIKEKSKVYTFKKDVSILKEATIYKVNNKFKYIEHLSALVLDYTSIDRDLLLSKLKTSGKIKYLLLSGIFTDFGKARLDILYVGEGMNVKEVEKCMSSISIELGRDLKYVIMDVEEYVYRKKMFDSFVIEVSEGIHEILIDKMPRT